MHMRTLFFNRRALFFFEISTVEESSQPTEHSNKILVSIFLTVKATILETHGIYKGVSDPWLCRYEELTFDICEESSGMKKR